jgi:predicted dehydrogenase
MTTTVTRAGDISAPLSVGLIGAGFMGQAHARAVIVNGARLAGVAASTPGRGVQAAGELGAERAYATGDDLIADREIDVVHICVPNALHMRLVRAAIAAGKHVVCEKPLATNLTDARELQTLAQRRDVIATVPYIYRYYPMVRDARRRASIGELGRLTLVHGSYLQDWLTGPARTNWRVDSAVGGPSRAFADIGSHWCDLAEFITGDRIAALSCQFQIVESDRPRHGGSATFSHGQSDTQIPAAPVDTEDSAVVQFQTAGGMLGSVVVSQVAPGRKNQFTIEVLGTSASLSFAHDRPDRIEIGRSDALTTIQRDPSEQSPEVAKYSRLPAGHPEGYQDCMNLFVGETYDAVCGGGVDPLLPTFASGVRAAAITHAAVTSARSRGSWVDVELAIEGYRQ